MYVTSSNFVEETSFFSLVYNMFLPRNFQMNPMIHLMSYRYGNGYFGPNRHLRVKTNNLVCFWRIFELYVKYV
jgi:hypothetical protein